MDATRRRQNHGRLPALALAIAMLTVACGGDSGEPRARPSDAVVVVTADGTQIQILMLSEDASQYLQGLRWSEDSTRVSYSDPNYPPVEYTNQLDVGGEFAAPVERELSQADLTRLDDQRRESPDGRMVAERGEGGLYLSDGQSVIKAFEGNVGAIRWSPDGEYIALNDLVLYDSLNRNHTYELVVIDAASRSVVMRASGVGGNPPVWSPDSSRVAVSGLPGVRILSILGGEDYEQPRCLGHPVSWSPDNRTLACIGWDGVYLTEYDSHQGSLLAAMREVKAGEVAWSPDGKYIAFIGELWPDAIADRDEWLAGTAEGLRYMLGEYRFAFHAGGRVSLPAHWGHWGAVDLDSGRTWEAGDPDAGTGADLWMSDCMGGHCLIYLVGVGEIRLLSEDPEEGVPSVEDCPPPWHLIDPVVPPVGGSTKLSSRVIETQYLCAVTDEGRHVLLSTIGRLPPSSGMRAPVDELSFEYEVWSVELLDR